MKLTDFTNRMFGNRKTENGTARHRFGTFGGVFTPDVLTILGVIMYLRLGWVVGQAGFLGAVLIILLAKSVTVCTALCMSSMTTNIKIGAGGAYSIISRSLGIEAGGGVGIPFYVSQTLSTALYVIGFTEGWMRIFPTHEPLVIASTAWFALAIISYVSARFAIRIQYVIMCIIGLSIFSFVLTRSPPNEQLFLRGTFESAGFWKVFAVFFPAVTGIMAGANMSGDLENPRRAIPLGTMSAIGVTTLIYIGLAYICARVIPPEALQNNHMVMVDRAIWKPIVLAGILAATFSSALGCMIGAPRILQALAEQKVVPFGAIFSRRTPAGDPRNALIFTAIIVEASIVIAYRDLNSLATLITMFFLITYGMLNLVVFIQQSMRIVSFRPSLRIPRIVSLYGTLSCLFIMFLINPVFSLLAIGTIIALYIWLSKRGLRQNWGDIRGGMFLMLAEAAARLADNFPRHEVSWKPDFLIPVDNPRNYDASLRMIESIAYPLGSVFAFTAREKVLSRTEENLDDLLLPLTRKGIRVNSTVIREPDFLQAAGLVIQTLKGSTLRPNLLFTSLSAKSANDDIISKLLKYSVDHEMGRIVFRRHTRVDQAGERDINLWLRDRSPNWHLAVLIALRINANWKGDINLITVAPEKNDRKRLSAFLQRLTERARLPHCTVPHVLDGEFSRALQAAPTAELNVFGVAETPDFAFMRKAPGLTGSPCLFIGDSGNESALV